MTVPRMTIIGCGRVGRTLGRALHGHKSITIAQILNRTPESSMRAVTFIGSGSVADSYGALKAADIFMLAGPDDMLQTMAAELAATGITTPETIVFHCSGALSSRLLSDAGLACQVASIHPARAFAEAKKTKSPLKDTLCGCEGSEQALGVLEPMVNLLGGKPFPVESEKKALYHAAACIASNYLVGLAACADQLFQSSGLSQEQARQLTQHLQESTMTNLSALGPDGALTGPLQRRDMDTTMAHTSALQSQSPDVGAAYQAMALLTSRLLVES